MEPELKFDSHKSVLVCKNGCVSSSQYLASQIGLGTHHFLLTKRAVSRLWMIFIWLYFVTIRSQTLSSFSVQCSTYGKPRQVVVTETCKTIVTILASERFCCSVCQIVGIVSRVQGLNPGSGLYTYTFKIIITA